MEHLQPAMMATGWLLQQADWHDRVYDLQLRFYESHYRCGRADALWVHALEQVLASYTRASSEHQATLRKLRRWKRSRGR